MPDAASGEPRILTPDQRPRVFISSTLAEMAAERVAARRAVESLRLIPVMFELGARPHPARALYRAYLAQSHVFIGLYAERYGWVAPGESVSGLEDEYLLSGGLPRLVYIRSPAPEREDRLDSLLDRIRTDDQVSYKSFAEPEELERLLRDDLAVLLAERFLIGGGWDDRQEEPPRPEQRAAATVHPLPRPLTMLIGRDDEIAEVEGLVARDARLVTLVGPGGIGKTRVALEVAHRAAGLGEREVAFVPLDAVRDSGAVLPAVGAALGIGLDGSVRAVDALSRALRDRSLLLVLDNLEQVLDCAPEVSALLESVPQLTIVATSRAPLRVRGEHQVPIGPLSLPNGDRRELDRYAAVRLFLDRAREVRPELTLDDPADAYAVAELTKRLEGIPLALELAASRSRTLPPRALLSRVSSALDLGSRAVDLPARQRTLRDTVAWSEELLAAPERLLLHQLAIFEAPWTLADAEAVAGDEIVDVDEAVAVLVENSLVHASATASGEPRFRLYEAVRAYARQHADDAEGARATQSRYIRRMATVIRDLDSGFRSKEHNRWRAEFRLIWPDLRSAFELSLAIEDPSCLGRLTGAWVGLWMDGRAQEIQDLMKQALALADRVPPPDHGDVVLSGVGLAFNLGDYDTARHLVRRLSTENLPAEQPEIKGTLELYEGYLTAGEGDLAQAEAHLRRAAQLLSEFGTGGQWIEAFARNGLGSLYALKGDLEASYREFDVSADLGRRNGNFAAVMQAQVFVAAMRIATGETGEASRLLAEASEFVERYPFYEGNAYCVEVAGAVALSAGDATAAARAMGAAAALREVTGARVWPLLMGVRDLIDQNVRAALDPSSFDAAFASGREVDLLTLAEVVRSLIGETSAG